MRRALAIATALTLGLNPVSARAFGAQGHQLIGAIADRLLNPNAAKQVGGLLGMKLRVAATWADCVKDVRPGEAGLRYVPDPHHHLACEAFETRAGVARMEDYVRRNWSACTADGHASACHKEYHYADIAIQRIRYDRAWFGAGDHDIVSVMQAAIDVLQGRPAPTPFSIDDKAEALLMLAHFVGDVHQPLHVGAIYLDPRGRPIDPDTDPRSRNKYTATRGGNSIEAGTTNLHAEWDEIPASLKPSPISRRMLAAAKALPTTGDDVRSWPGNWASETLITSRMAYAGLTFTPLAAKQGYWAAHFDNRAAYLETKNQVQTEQLTRAGARLAQLLNTIWP
jgi:S1/P1 Nuclease